MAVAEPTAPEAVRADKPSLWTKLAYGFGSVAFGVKDNGFSFYLLLFYSQVLGVNAGLVGLALTIALVIDAISDPVVGYWSDNFRSKWGRRHVFMYASAIPIAATYFLLWAPPEGLTEIQLFWYLLVLAVLIRTFVTFYETPSSALGPELTRDYDQRSTLFSFRYFFAWTGGNLMSAFLFIVIFPAFAVAGRSGQFERGAYEVYGIIASIFMFIGVMVSALGTHSRIAHLPPPPPKRTLTLRRVFGEIFETLGEPSFITLFVATLFAAVAAGLSSAMSVYISTFFWGFSPQEIGVIVLGVFISAFIGPMLATPVTKAIGKKRGAMAVGLVAFVGAPLPITLKLFGLLPDDHAFQFWFVFITSVIDVSLIITFQILFTAMIADLVEQAELKTGRRSEGIFFAAVTFTRKSVQGLGVLAASLVLALAQFPKGATPDQVDPDTVWRLGAIYTPTILFFYMAMMAVISTYKLDRKGHEENLRKLAARTTQ